MTDKTKNRFKNQMVYVILALVMIAIICIAIAVSTSGAKRNHQTTAPKVTQPPVTQPPVTTIPPSSTTPPADDPVITEPKPLTFVAPVAGILTQGHDEDALVFSPTMDDYRVHLGIDVQANAGSEVVCVADGTVKSVYEDPFMGISVVVDHGNGLTSIYQNLSEVLAEDIAEGVKVNKGDALGSIGETALSEIAQEPHLHFEMKKDSLWVDPLDYVKYEQSESAGNLYEDE